MRSCTIKIPMLQGSIQVSTRQLLFLVSATCLLSVSYVNGQQQNDPSNDKVEGNTQETSVPSNDQEDIDDVTKKPQYTDNDMGDKQPHIKKENIENIGHDYSRFDDHANKQVNQHENYEHSDYSRQEEYLPEQSEYNHKINDNNQNDDWSEDQVYNEEEAITNSEQQIKNTDQLEELNQDSFESAEEQSESKSLNFEPDHNNENDQKDQQSNLNQYDNDKESAFREYKMQAEQNQQYNDQSEGDENKLHVNHQSEDVFNELEETEQDISNDYYSVYPDSPNGDNTPVENTDNNAIASNPIQNNGNDNIQEKVFGQNTEPRSESSEGFTSSTKPIEEEAKEMSAEEIEAERLYQAGEKLVNTTYFKEYKEAYLYFLKAADLNHFKAKAYVAFGHLFGDYLPQNITKASEIFQELASKGFPKAQLGLAFMYSTGMHYNSSQAKALIYLTFGALGGEPLSQMALAYRYYAGVGVESKCETALTYYRKVATKVAERVTYTGGPVVQRIRLQEEADSQSNNSPLLDDDLLQYYHFLADKGDQQAQIVLGTLYYQGGKGVQINHEQAHHYFSIAAESGNAHALGYLGKMHSEGSPFVKQDNQTALEYFKRSAEKNNHVGQAGLGIMYLHGYGVEKDFSKAFRYFSLASDQGSVDGQLQLGIMYFTGKGIRKDYKMAVKYFTLASQNGHVLAYFNLAQMHATGTGVLRSCHTAVELFKNVAERGRWAEMLMDAHRMYQNGNLEPALMKYMFMAELGYEVAQSNVAWILDNGIVNKFEKHEMYQRALLQYSRAAVQGSAYARLKIGDYHYYGKGTEIDYESAASHYRIASETQRNAQAMFNLGYMHERGLGMKQDVHLAKRFYDMAAETNIDAHIPVTLALLKLGLFYGVDVFSKEFEGFASILELMDPGTYLGDMWDVYMAALFALVFTLVFFMRRMR